MNKADWEAIESAYRAGVKSIREIASENSITDGAVRKRAKRDGWSRDLSAKIRQKAEELVRTREVRSKVRTEDAISERVLIQSNAEAIANKKMEWRGDIGKARNLVNILFSELESECNDVEALRKLGEILREPDQNNRDKLNDIYQAIISLPERVKSVKALSEALKNLIGLEREAYGVTSEQEKTDVNINIRKSLTDLFHDE